MQTCPSCGRGNDQAASFCDGCGARLSHAEPGREQRKTVTVLFCDLVHSTGLAEGDPEAYRRIQARYFQRMQEVIERHGGTVEKFVGDEVMAVFGVPVVHEDDALRAARAATEMMDQLAALNDELGSSLPTPLQARIGINTGEVLAGDPARGHAFVAGEPVIVGKRLEQAAEPGQILIGKATYPLVKHAVRAGPLERIPVKGKGEHVGKRRLEHVRQGAPGVARQLHAPIVGRDRELRLLEQAFERAVAERSCRLLTIIGPAGIGKSRLATELLSDVAGKATVGVGRCPSYGEGITYWPLTEALRELGGETAVTDALADDRPNEEVFLAVRHTLEALARERPLVLSFEDVHWAEQTMLDLVEYVVGWSRGAPMLIIALARPDFIERRPQWATPHASYDALTLEPLSSDAAEALLAGLSVELPAEVKDRIVEAAEGNPLFVEQMGAMVAEDGDDVSIPPSIQALLAERLDRLGADEREVIERASIAGRDFTLTAVTALFPEEQRAFVAPQLFALMRKGLVLPDPSPSANEDRFRFQHALVCEAAHEAMSKERRAVLHERFAGWLEGLERGQELDELIGYHLEQAHRNRLELGEVDEQTHALAGRASELLISAGGRALDRGDVQAALKLLDRAVRLRPEDDAAVLGLSQALFQAGHLARAIELANEVAARASSAGDEVAALRARLTSARIRLQTLRGEAGAGRSRELLELAEAARPVFARHGDDLALGEAWHASAWAHFVGSRYGAMLEAVEHALEHARRAGSTRWERELPAWKGSALLYGPARVDEGLRWFEGQQTQHPVALGQQAVLEAMRENFEEARSLARSAESIAEEHGQMLWLAGTGMALCEIELLAGNPALAETAVRRSCELLEELGETGHRSFAAGELADSLYALGQFDEAEEWADTARELSASDDVASQMLWRRVRGRLLARRGESAEAEELALEAVSLAEQTDMLNWHANALVDLAEVYSLAGRAEESAGRLEQAIALYERKGNRTAARKARTSAVLGSPVAPTRREKA